MSNDEPCAALTTPPIIEPHNIVSDVLQILDVVPSWSTLLVKALELLGLEDPFKKASELFTGDWIAIQQAGGALKNVADYNRLFAGQLDRGIKALTGDPTTWAANDGGRPDPASYTAPWAGHAATAAYGYFTTYAQRLRDEASVLESTGAAILDGVNQVYYRARLIEGLLQDAFDSLMELIAATIKVGKTPPLGMTEQVAGVVKKALHAIDLAQQAFTTVMALINEVMAGPNGKGFALGEPARGRYDHQGVEGNIDQLVG